MLITLTLTAEELIEITARVRPSAQIRWLDRHGWPYVRGADGHPKVLRAFVQSSIGGIALAHTSRPGPDWDALDGTA